MAEQKPIGSSYAWLADIGMTLGVAGAATSVVGTYYGLKAQQGQLKAEALNAEFAASQANIAARAAERNAHDIIRAGQMEQGVRGMQEAVDRAAFRANAAASGVEVGSGSAAEADRAMQLAAELDKRTIQTNAQMRANATREVAANQRGSGLLARATAANLRGAASTINPVAGAVGAAAGAGGSLINQYLTFYGRR